MLIDFKNDLSGLTSSQLVRKYVLTGNCHILSEDQHFRLKEEISTYLEIGFNDVVLVGSAKLGFSIKADKRFQEFGESSDIDIAVVSTKLFELVWQEALIFRKSGAYWPKSISFFKYLSEGWIRPDKLPTSEYFVFTKKWWDFFTKISSSKKYGDFSIRGGLYHSMFFLEEYQKICIEQCIEEKN